MRCPPALHRAGRRPPWWTTSEIPGEFVPSYDTQGTGWAACVESIMALLLQPRPAWTRARWISSEGRAAFHLERRSRLASPDWRPLSLPEPWESAPLSGYGGGFPACVPRAGSAVPSRGAWAVVAPEPLEATYPGPDPGSPGDSPRLTEILCPANLSRNSRGESSPELLRPRTPRLGSPEDCWHRLIVLGPGPKFLKEVGIVMR